MQWELVATWAAVALTVISGIYAMGKQSQKINDQQNQLNELKEDIKSTQETAVKVAALETDIKYLVQGMAEIKTYIMRKVE